MIIGINNNLYIEEKANYNNMYSETVFRQHLPKFTTLISAQGRALNRTKQSCFK